MFSDYIERIKAEVGEERTATILSNSIFIVCSGSNDIGTYFNTHYRKYTYDVDAYTNLMIDSASSFLQVILGTYIMANI